MKYILVIDQGTTSSRAILFNVNGEAVGQAQQEFKQIYPHPGWVEHDPIDILSSVRSVISTALTEARVKHSELIGMGITNQRESIVMWDKQTGEPIYNAIVWQCRRTMSRCIELEEYKEEILKRTGLKLDSYFSASKIEWLLKNVDKAKELLDRNRLCVGTIDTFLMWQLSGGKIYKTDYTNASRTMLYNIHELCWDSMLCDLFGIPKNILPEVCPSSHIYGYTDQEILGFKIPICGVAGDQQSALFGQCCFEKGDLKVTYGTGCFLLMNTGSEAFVSKNGLITSLGCQTNQKPSYVLEGSVFVGGAVIQWLRDELKVISSATESEALARSVENTNGVYLVPAFVGLGAPYWNFEAEGLITGITRGTNKAHITRAALEAIAFEVNDVVEAMKKDIGVDILTIEVDGGAIGNNFLMEFQADISNAYIARPKNKEVTALGAFYLAALELQLFDSLEEIKLKNPIERTFIPNMSKEERETKLKGWNKAIRKASLK
ncbi:MAG: glycerol kinase GlpK [Anaeroplasmataceae bacterium]|nr:glycerol kinase GlpK [Anaeroplasmataceae bacterium]MDE6414259.1 glycerol kinase GlpK [Anaeroplasmataceae bacterium]